jgi:hypothetical protein
VKIDLPLDIDPAKLGREVNKLLDRERRSFIKEFLSELDTDTYHTVAKYLADEPDKSIECPLCKRHTVKIDIYPKCGYCGAGLP